MTTHIIIKEIIPGMNGSDGLMREHWAKAAKRKEKYQLLIMAQTRNKHKGKVTITYTGYYSILRDWDNHTASFKHLGDALQKAGVIKDDSPKIVVEFIPKQVKCSRVEQRAEILIEDYEITQPIQPNIKYK